VTAGFFGWREFGAAPAPEVRFPNENYRVIASTLDERILPDGSRARLNGSSRIETDFTATERRVRLVDGEAHFVVTKDPARPFLVTAGAVTVRAVGTAFNVRLAAETIEVLVTEGKVQLQQDAAKSERAVAVPAAVAVPGPALVQGQRAIIARSAPPAATAVPAVAIGEVGKAEIEAALGWQSTRLVFSNTPLDEVVEGFNRYNTHRLTLGDPALRERALTGVFRADNLDGFVRLLKSSIDVKAEQRTPTETVLLPLR
jgi:transmembrane sensor